MEIELPFDRKGFLLCSPGSRPKRTFLSKKRSLSLYGQNIEEFQGVEGINFEKTFLPILYKRAEAQIAGNSSLNIRRKINSFGPPVQEISTEFLQTVFHPPNNRK